MTEQETIRLFARLDEIEDKLTAVGVMIADQHRVEFCNEKVVAPDFDSDTDDHFGKGESQPI